MPEPPNAKSTDAYMILERRIDTGVRIALSSSKDITNCEQYKYAIFQDDPVILDSHPRGTRFSDMLDGRYHTDVAFGDNQSQQ